jgi:hypothetical protein
MEPHQLHLAIDPLGHGKCAFFDGSQGEPEFLTQAGEQIEMDHGWLRIDLLCRIRYIM